MCRSGPRLAASLVVVLVILTAAAFGQKHQNTSASFSRPVLWESVNISRRDTFLGPGGTAMQPDLSHITLLKEEKGGYSLKYKIKDGAGRTWVAKIGKEAQSETAAVRLLWALG